MFNCLTPGAGSSMDRIIIPRTMDITGMTGAFTIRETKKAALGAGLGAK